MNVQIDSVIALLHLLGILLAAWWLIGYIIDTYRIGCKEKAERILRLFDD